MYEAFYGLREKPFNLTPDPKYLYLSDKHKEAFAHLLYGIKNHSGFVMVTGEIGTGKTTICRNLLNQLDSDTELAFVFNPSLNPIELLKKICAEFRIETGADNLLDLTEVLNGYLLDAAANGKNCVLVIDEAQNLTPQVLEQIRLLSNLETATEKLLQIILIGQPELTEKLALKELRQLDQRITARYHLKPLSAKETLQYIAYRLHVAGGRRKVKFAKPAVRAIYKYSTGTPRVINAICDRALLIGYTKEVHSITAPIIRRAAREIRGESVVAGAGWRKALRRWAPSPSLVLGAILVFLVIRYVALPLDRAGRELGVFNALLATEESGAGTPTVDTPQTARAITDNGTDLASRAADVLVESPLARKALKKLTAPELPAAPTPAFGEQLATLDPDASRKGAAMALLRAWRMALVSGYPADDTVESLAEFARQNGLAYEVLAPAVDQLLAINLPAFVLMRTGEKTLWLCLVGFQDGRLRLTADAGNTLDVSRGDFVDHYAGQAVLLWRDATPRAPDLLPNQTGVRVAALKEKLRRLGRLASNNTSDQYDTKTAAAVARIQAETGLLIDGMSGKQVRMVLSSWLPEGLNPTLQASSPTEFPAMPAPIVAYTAPVGVYEADTRSSESVAQALPAPSSTEAIPDTFPLPEAVPSLELPPVLDGLPPEQPGAAVQVRDLPAPSDSESLAPMETQHLKEVTPPAAGNLPLVPHEPVSE